MLGQYSLNKLVALNCKRRNIYNIYPQSTYITRNKTTLNKNSLEIKRTFYI